MEVKIYVSLQMLQVKILLPFFIVIHKAPQYQEGLPQNLIVITTSEAFLKKSWSIFIFSSRKIKLKSHHK